MTEMTIVLHEDDRVDAVWDGLTVRTDQDGSAPAPFDLFLASLGTCAGIYVARFCRHRGLSTRGIGITQRAVLDPVTRLLDRVELDIRLPDDFPARYHGAVARAAELCTVKKTLARPPAIAVRTVQEAVAR